MPPLYSPRSETPNTSLKELKELGQIPEGSIAPTPDVGYLYTCTCIPNKQAIDAILDHLRKDHRATMPCDKMGKLLEIIQHMNHLEFNKQLYLQISETAMGTACVLSLANLFIGRFEKDLLEHYDLKHLIWLQFIDIIWTHGEDELDKFVAHANSVHPTIKFTCHHSRTAVEFLDTIVIIDPLTYELYTSLYITPINTRDFLLFDSVQPHSTKLGGPYGQFLRIRRICTRDYDLSVESWALFLAYLKWGYPHQIWEKRLYRTSLFQHDNLLNTKTREKSDRQVFVTTYNPGNPNIMGILKKYWPILHANRIPMCAFRRQKKWRDTWRA